MCLYVFGLKYCLINVYHVKAVRDDISAKTIPVWLHHTVSIEKPAITFSSTHPPLLKAYVPRSLPSAPFEQSWYTFHTNGILGINIDLQNIIAKNNWSAKMDRLAGNGYFFYIFLQAFLHYISMKIV